MATDSQPTKKRGLVAIVGAAAAAALYTLTPSFEGTVQKTYKDIGGVLSYCTGATENAQWGKTYTMDECKSQLDRDLARHAEGVMSCIHKPLTDGQRVAYTDLAFNIGVQAFCGSTAAYRANQGDLEGSCNALMKWNRAAGKEVAGLTRRRAAEREICLKGIP